MDAVLDRQEQYSRRNCPLIHGVDEVEGEDTELSIKVIEENMNQKIKHDDIADWSHRLGNPTKSENAKS